MWKLHSIFTQALFPQLSPWDLRQQQLLTEHSLRTRWCSGSVATTGLFIFASDSKSLSSSYISLRDFVWYLYKHSPSALIAVLWEPFYLSKVGFPMLQSHENSKGPSYTLQQFKPAEISWKPRASRAQESFCVPRNNAGHL